MTSDQQQLFIKAMQHGAAGGISNRFQCLVLFIRQNPAMKQDLISAFAAFERGCGHCHESAIELEGMSDDRYWQWVQQHYPIATPAGATP